MPMPQKLGPRISNVYMAVLWNPGGQVLMPMLQKLGPGISNVYMAVLQNPGGQTLTSKKKHGHQLCKRIGLHGKRPLDL